MSTGFAQGGLAEAAVPTLNRGASQERSVLHFVYLSGDPAVGGVVSLEAELEVVVG